MTDQLMQTLIERLQGRIDTLFEAIAHGDEDHRAWLKEAITAHFAGGPVPEPRGKGNKEAAIERLTGEVERMREIGAANERRSEQTVAMEAARPKEQVDLRDAIERALDHRYGDWTTILWEALSQSLTGLREALTEEELAKRLYIAHSKRHGFSGERWDEEPYTTQGSWRATARTAMAALSTAPTVETSPVSSVPASEMPEAFELAIVTHNYLRYAEHHLPNNDIGLPTPEEIMEDWCEWIDRNRASLDSERIAAKAGRGQ